MTKFFDVYIRLTGPALDPADILTGNILDGWDRLELVDAKAMLMLEGSNKKEISDGTEVTDQEKLSFECATLRVDATEYGYLKQTFHNQVCDVMCYDPNDNTMICVGYRIVLAVTPVAKSGEAQLIKLAGSRIMSNAAADAALAILAPTGAVGGYAIVTGIVYETDGITPVAGVLVHLENVASDAWEDTSDKDGSYLISLPAGDEYSFVVTKSGGWVFPDDITLTAVPDMDNVQNIVAETDAGS